MNKHFINLKPGEKVYFASDFHLGAPDPERSLLREKEIVQWLDFIKKDAAALFLVGDIFDFWFEYKYVIPKGFIRFLGKLAELSDQGVALYLYTGNHDLWINEYISSQLNSELFRSPQQFTINEMKFFVGHGDGLGPGDNFFKFVKKIFMNPFCQWMFRWVHPDIGVALARLWSSSSRKIDDESIEDIKVEKEALITYSKNIEATEHHDLYIFGHRHLPLNISIDDHCRYINLGEWFTQKQYGVFNGKSFELKSFNELDI